MRQALPSSKSVASTILTSLNLYSVIHLFDENRPVFDQSFPVGLKLFFEGCIELFGRQSNRLFQFVECLFGERVVIKKIRSPPKTKRSSEHPETLDWESPIRR